MTPRWYALLLLFAAVHVPSAHADVGVLVLHGNQRATPAQVVIDDTLRTAIANGFDGQLQVFSEYLDDEWTSVASQGGKTASYLQDKYERRNLRVIVADAIAALEFATRYHEQLGGLPIVVVAVSRDRVDAGMLTPAVTGNFEDNDPTPTLKLALDLHPQAKRFVLIRGDGARGRLWDQRMQAAMARLPRRVDLEYLTALPMAEVLRKVAELPQDTVVFTPGFFTDGAGQITTPRQATERIAAASAVPVYGAFDTAIGTGVVGGYVTRYEDQAKEAGAIVGRLLRGATAGDIPRGTATRVAAVDARQLRRLGIEESRLPPGTVVRFREPSLWEAHRAGISIGIVVVLLQTALIGALLTQKARRRRAESASSMLAGRLLTAHEDERRRLARDLHDDVSQRLARLAIDAGRLERDTGTPTLARTVREELVRLSEDVHGLSYQLHPSVLEDLGLADGIKAECDRLSRQTSIPVSVTVEPLPPKLPREHALCLFRIAQEALRNAVRHAHPSRISVSLAAPRDGLTLVVRDDGKGFDIDGAAQPSLGQMSMRERVRMLRGKLRIDSAPGHGTTVTAWVPL